VGWLRETGWLGEIWGGLVDLVLPGTCAGCAAAGHQQLCPDCRALLAGLRPHRVRPTPAPAGLPPCVALGGYDGVLREALLAYKERGRYPLAAPLGDLLARVVVAGLLGTGYPAGSPVLLVPVPDTAAAARARYGDHLQRLARRCAAGLARYGWPAGIAAPVAARPRADSARLDSAGRAALAAQAFAPRSAELARVLEAQRRGAVLVALDDIVTTGATLAALAAVLDRAGVRVPLAATLAATRRRPAWPVDARPGGRPGPGSPEQVWHPRHLSG
jgi:predicted amidophosphoribosyltransferase